MNGTGDITLSPLSPKQAADCAAIHAVSFETGWDAAAISAYITPKAAAFGAFEAGKMAGFILMGALTDQTDIITLAVSPSARGRGIAKQLVRAAEAEAAARGAEIIFLEVAEDNAAAIALYKGAGYRAIGKRKNYYRREGGRVSALTMRKDLS